MAQFRTTADIVDSVLSRSGEVSNGNSKFEARALEFVNRIHRTIIIGGSEFNIEVDEVWAWARAQKPMIIELKPKYNTGSITLTKGSEAGTFSDAPSSSLAGWHLQVSGRDGVFKIASHSAAATAFELDGAYDSDSGASLTFQAFKLDYELVPSYLIIDSESNRLEFQKAVGVTLTATLTEGAYTPSQLATHAAAAMTTAAAGPTITGSYDSITKKFTFISNGAGATTFIPQFASGSNAYRSAHRLLGFDDEDLAASLTQTSTYILGGIGRLIEPMTIYRGMWDGADDGQLYGIDKLRFQKDYPLLRVQQGVPDRFCKIIEKADGTIIVRLNKYVETETRLEVDFIPVPRDLKDNASSIPLIPRKFIEILEYGAASDLTFEKSDDRTVGYANKAGLKLQAMVNQNRAELFRIGERFGQVVAREDLLYHRRKLIYGVPEDQ